MKQKQNIMRYVKNAVRGKRRHTVSIAILTVAFFIFSSFPSFTHFTQAAAALLDNTTSSSFSNSSSTTWLHTVNGSDRLLVVGVSHHSELNQTVASVTYGGANLTRYITRKQGAVSAELWYRVAPALGTNTVAVLFSSSTSGTAGATSWTGVNQTVPLGLGVSAGARSTAPSLAVSSATDETVHDVLAWNRRGTTAATATIDPSQSQRWNVNSSSAGGAASTKAGAASVTMNWTLSVSKDWALVSASIKPVPSVPDTTAPVISNVNAGSITSSSATITWTTDEISNSQVEYGLDTNYGNQTALDTTMVTSHAQVLNGLAPTTLYHYLVKSTDPSGNPAVSGDNIFTTPAAPTALNIVAIVVDDLSINTLNDGIANGWMPNLKSNIIDQGMNFTNSFVADAVCCPSRATFLTGQQSHNHGVLSNDFTSSGGVTRLNDSSTLATWLKNAGYRTGLVGKYLNGYGQNLSSTSPTDDPTYIPPGWDDWQASLGGSMYNYTFNDNAGIITYGSQPQDYQTDVLATRAADFIRESDALNDAQPFFLWLTPGAPHAQGGAASCAINNGSLNTTTPAPRHIGIAATLPLPQPLSFNESDVTDKPTWLQNNYPLLTSAHISCLTTIHRDRVETIMAVDDLIGMVIAELQTRGELGNTVVMFTSDNGFLLGEHRLSEKRNVYEGSIRVPLYVKGPGIIGPQTASQMVVNVDLAPTVVELAGATAGLTMDGRSLVPIFQNPGFSPWRNYFLIEDKKIPNSVMPDYSAVRSPQYVYVEYVDGSRELYDLATDPDELMSQHANPAYGAMKTTLKQKLNTLKTCAGSTCWQ